MCPLFKPTIDGLDDSISLDVKKHHLKPAYYSRGELEEFSVTAGLMFLSWSRSQRRSKSHLTLVHQRCPPWPKDQLDDDSTVTTMPCPSVSEPDTSWKKR
ncbi:hypothetical protein CEXT_513901 [Caerostris extrusa]|uniref:Uncharacterized protein n=1 Tax=Caerostris extrusa TaxID=172846 RepID=A0AAV4V2T2_CAEEX|nr:hypothetical protein CEXT_513901 [Caerostris extrusa]